MANALFSLLLPTYSLFHLLDYLTYYSLTTYFQFFALKYAFLNFSLLLIVYL